ncbi:SDR family oxidoreductase [Paraburkholderia tropica]|uniref:SDR family oxidoreductase n=1 Tax=Paraburkholderia tropica TaxID=92647 RepID=UPI002AB69F2E|nr:SDR family oxidoreductase [Paraburkholderia tropica]
MPFSDYRTALVTGASSGIGAAVVERLSREGIEVHAVARSASRLAELSARTGCKAHAIDVSDLTSITALAGSVPFDIVVNNAGISTPGSILSAQAEDIDRQVEVNLQAVLHIVRLTMPGMVARDRGHVVNISSIAAIYNFSGNSIYHATKAGIHALCRQLRVDAMGKRVRVTEICPGRVATDIFGHVSGDVEAARKEFIDGFELPRPEDVADAIAFVINAPLAVNISNMEIVPTLQVPGGLTTVKRED